MVKDQIQHCSGSMPWTEYMIPFISNFPFQERLFQCWFNTFFVKDTEECQEPIASGKPELVKRKYLTLTMAKCELDKANKDKDNKIYNKNFKVRNWLFQGPYSPTILKNILCLFIQDL